MQAAGPRLGREGRWSVAELVEAADRCGSAVAWHRAARDGWWGAKEALLPARPGGVGGLSVPRHRQSQSPLDAVEQQQGEQSHGRGEQPDQHGKP